MPDYYCYIYYDENWVAYYVGKGCRNRKLYRQDAIPVATKKYTQVFQFVTEWEAFECERELVSLWGRQIDGGSLMNTCLGGPGTPGRPMSDAHKQAIRRRHSGTPPHINSVIASSKPMTIQCIQTGEVKHFPSAASVAKFLNVAKSTARSFRNSPTHSTCKGWRLTNDYA